MIQDTGQTTRAHQHNHAMFIVKCNKIIYVKVSWKYWVSDLLVIYSLLSLYISL